MSECIEWQGSRNRNGYGSVRAEGRTWLAHRWAWVQVHGPIPEGLVVRHRCDNPPCVNVEHLEIGTHADNMRDAVERGRTFRPSLVNEACGRGHAFTPENTGFRADGKGRFCIECRRQAQRARRAANPKTARKIVSVCKRGHEFTPENTYDWNGHRHCKTCQIERQRDRRAAERQAKAGAA